MMELPVAKVTEAMRAILTPSGDQPEELGLLLNAYAMAGAVGYRVGCTQPVGGGRYPCIRWFPSSVSRRCPIFKLEPFEPPVVPIPFDYVVAYFDAQNRVIGKPSMRVSIPYFLPKLNWSTGDRNLKVDPPEPEQI